MTEFWLHHVLLGTYRIWYAVPNILPLHRIPDGKKVTHLPLNSAIASLDCSDVQGFTGIPSLPVAEKIEYLVRKGNGMSKTEA
jgi:hypothetical protein